MTTTPTPQPNPSRTPIEQAMWDSGYAFTQREEDIAKEFYERGQKAVSTHNQKAGDAIMPSDVTYPSNPTPDAERSDPSSGGQVPTPRTEEQAYVGWSGEDKDLSELVIPATLSEQLERELSTANLLLEAEKKELAQAKAENQQMQEERDRETEFCMGLAMIGPDAIKEKFQECADLKKRLTEALAALELCKEILIKYQKRYVASPWAAKDHAKGVIALTAAQKILEQKQHSAS